MYPPSIRVDVQGGVDQSVGLLLRAHGDPADLESLLRAELAATVEAMYRECEGKYGPLPGHF